jgi:FG-GAP repeat/FG-GAP-like repeat
MKAGIRRGMVCSLMAAISVVLSLPAAAQVQVTSAVPNNTPQGTTNLIVKIGGSGFKRGASAAFYVTGTLTPGGITVNSTAFVSKSEVDANITVAANATVSGFDVYVSSGGRTGKGVDLFAVTSNPNQCTTQGTAAGWTQVDVLNHVDGSGNPEYTAGTMGVSLQIQLVSAPDTTGAVVPQFYAGLEGSGSGNLMVAFVLNLDGTVRRSWPVLNMGSGDIQVGDVNGDGAPDFVSAQGNSNEAHLFIGHLTGSPGNWDYSIDPATDVVLISPPQGAPKNFGRAVAMGDLDGDGLSEVVVSATSTTHAKLPGMAYIYKFNGRTLNLVSQIADPTGSSKNGFGNGLAIGVLTIDPSTGAPLQDLVVGNYVGVFYVFQDPLGSNSLPVLSYSVTSTTGLGHHAAVADVTGDGVPDLVVVGGEQADVYAGPISAGEAPTYVFTPEADLSDGWGTGFNAADIDGDGRADVLVGAPNASLTCVGNGNVGAAYVFRTGSPLFPNYSDLFEVPDVNSGGLFGYSVAAAPYNSSIAQPIVLVGQNGATVGTQSGAGQVYIFRKTQ